MRIAAIDIGSNSIHMVTAEVRRGGFEIMDRAKEMVGLARHTLSQGKLSPQSMEFGLATLARFRRLAERQGADPIIAVATSAVREASNGGEFALRAWEELGLHIDVITGEREARLIFTAARHALDFNGERPLVVDVGGGSVELIQGTGDRIKWQQSLKLGVVRLTERFLHSDPPKAAEVTALRSYLRRELKECFERARRFKPTMLIGTSGTLLRLVEMAAAMRPGKISDTLHHQVLKRDALSKLTTILLEADSLARAQMPGLERRRVDLIGAGAVLAETLLEGFKCKQLRACEWALREGLILDYISHHQHALLTAQLVPDLRRRSVLEMATRYGHDEETHGRQVAHLALGLFEASRPLHKLGNTERELLEYAALLHDVGLHVSHSKHHRHSHYLITQGELRGFEAREVELIGNIARFHKGAPPKPSSEELAALAPRDREIIIQLAALLRIADGLDRSRHSVVRSVRMARHNGAMDLFVDAAGRDAELEIWAAERKSELFSKCFGLGLKFQSEN